MSVSQPKLQPEPKRPVFPLYAILRAFPGSMMIIPLLLSATATTVAGAFGVNIWTALGDPVEMIFSSRGILGFLGLMLFFTGTQTNLKRLGHALKTGLPLILVRFGLSYGIGFLALWLWGMEGFAGLSFVDLIPCLTPPNAVLFSGITDPYADDADRSYFSICLLLALPVLPLIAIQGAENTPIDYMMLISMVIPLVLGLAMGNLDARIAHYFANGNAVILMFLGFQFGSYIDLTHAVNEIPSALVLMLVFYAVTIIPSLFVEVFAVKRTGYMTLAMSGLAGVSLSIPGLAAAAYADGELDAIAQKATYQLAFVLIVTCLLAPLLTDMVNRLAFARTPERLKLSTPRLYESEELGLEKRNFRRELRYVEKSLDTVWKDGATLTLSAHEADFVKNHSRQAIRFARKTLKSVTAGPSYTKEAAAKTLADFNAGTAKNHVQLQHLALLMAQVRSENAKRVLALSDDRMRKAVGRTPLLDPFRPAVNRRIRKANQPLLPLPRLSAGELGIRCVREYTALSLRQERLQETGPRKRSHVALSDQPLR